MKFSSSFLIRLLLLSSFLYTASFFWSETGYQFLKFALEVVGFRVSLFLGELAYLELDVQHLGRHSVELGRVLLELLLLLSERLLLLFLRAFHQVLRLERVCSDFLSPETFELTQFLLKIVLDSCLFLVVLLGQLLQLLSFVVFSQALNFLFDCGGLYR